LPFVTLLPSDIAVSGEGPRRDDVPGYHRRGEAAAPQASQSHGARRIGHGRVAAVQRLEGVEIPVCGGRFL
jgi:hypothetical protein